MKDWFTTFTILVAATVFFVAVVHVTSFQRMPGTQQYED